MEAKHLASEPQKPRWRRSRKAVVFTASTALMVIAGIAVAALLVRAPINGGGTIAAAPLLKFVTGTHVVSEEEVDCSVSFTPDLATVTMDNMIAGVDHTCIVHFTVQQQASGLQLVWQNVRYTNPDIVQVSFPGQPEETQGGCGAPINPLNPTNVDVRFHVPAGVAAQSFSAEAAAGLEAVRTGDYSEAACPGPAA